MIVVGPSPGKGRGVFASRRIEAGESIEEAPVVVVPGAEIEHVDRTVLGDYYFLWGADEEDAALLLGLCSLCNHSYQPNAVFECQSEAGTIRFVALRPSRRARRSPRTTTAIRTAASPCGSTSSRDSGR
jgi:SET domain-containing protein